MSGEILMSPEELGLELEGDKSDKKDSLISDIEQSDSDPSGQGSNGREATSPEQNGIDSVTSQSELSQKSSAKKPTLGRTRSAGAPRPSGGSGESVFDNFKKLAEGVEEDSGLGNMTK